MATGIFQGVGLTKGQDQLVKHGQKYYREYGAAVWPPATIKDLEGIYKVAQVVGAETSTGEVRGLIEAVRESEISTATAEIRTLEFLREHCEEGQHPLCGNTIGQDRRFLRAYMPDLADFCHYRSVDVTSVKELARRWYPESVPYNKPADHRALDDIKGSIDELSHYREQVFR